MLFKDLENYIRNHSASRLEKIQEIGKQLIDSNIMTHSIKVDVEGLTNRWNDLNRQVYTYMYAICPCLLLISIRLTLRYMTF